MTAYELDELYTLAFQTRIYQVWCDYDEFEFIAVCFHGTNQVSAPASTYGEQTGLFSVLLSMPAWTCARF